MAESRTAVRRKSYICQQIIKQNHFFFIIYIDFLTHVRLREEKIRKKKVKKKGNYG